MSGKENSKEAFSFSFRAACNDCSKYVGPKRDEEADADADGQTHKEIPGNEDHDVITEETQST